MLERFSIQDYTSVSDFVSKVGRSLKVFGKGGHVDAGRVRVRLIGDWFTGKLNSLLD